MPCQAKSFCHTSLNMPTDDVLCLNGVDPSCSIAPIAEPSCVPGIDGLCTATEDAWFNARDCGVSAVE
jgi:hypothetical protein